MPDRQKTWISAFGFIILMFTAVAWASPVPDTGQNKCYGLSGVITCPSPGQALYGQDGNYAINTPTYTKLDGSGNVLPDSAMSWVMVRDDVTGLIWENKTNDGTIHAYNKTYTWYDPTDPNPGTPGNGTDTKYFIDTLNSASFGGYSDWRLPTVKELGTIVNYGIPSFSFNPMIHDGYFPYTAYASYWSSTTYASDISKAWLVLFVSGGVLEYNKNYAGHVRAVRGGQFEAVVIGSFDAVDSGSIDGGSTSAGGYTDNGDGTVTDTSTGLMWQQASYSNYMTWEQALAYCEGLNLGGNTDWRLPNAKELQSLVDYSHYNPAINTTYFPDTAASHYWSSTSNADGSNCEFGVHFNYGGVGGASLGKFGSIYYARAVRGGQNNSVISVSPISRAVAKDAGATTFSVSNTGTGIMQWTVEVTSGTWLSITSGASGSNSGTITCGFTANTSTSARTATIRVAATGATGSPVDVTVIQAGSSGALAASFPGSGLWIYNLDSATWTQITTTNPENMIYSGLTLYVDFGASYGLYKWDGASWAQLAPASPENMVTSGASLYVDFGASYGLYKWESSSWSQLTGSNPLIMVVSN
jgi:hypothetical protein